MYHYLEDKYGEEEDEYYLDLTVEQFDIDEERREQELREFLEDFVTSEEYLEYLETKRNIIKVDASTQYRSTDFDKQYEEECEIIEDKYPLTTQSRKMFAFTKQFESYINKRRNLDALERQENGIKAIREKISELKKIYYCGNEETEIVVEKETKKKKQLERFSAILNIELSGLNLNVRNKIRDKVLCYRKIIHSRKLKRKQNYIGIVRKLTQEYKRQAEIDNMLNKTYTYKVKKDERIIEDMEIVGQHITLKSRYEYEECIEEEVVEDYEPVVEKEPKKSKPDKKDKKDKKDKGKGKGKDKSKKESKSSKSSKSKEGKGKKTKEDELVIPLIPICNERRKINAKNKERLIDLITQFQQLEDVLENKHMMTEGAPSEEMFDIDNNFACNPEVVYYRNFQCGKVYKKKVKVFNVSPGIHKFRMKKLIFPNEYDSLFFTIEPRIGIQKSLPGCPTEFTLIFVPINEYKPLEGRVLFISYDAENVQYKRFYLYIKCIPIYSDLEVCPPVVNFGKIPIWRSRNVHTKSIKMVNAGMKPCKVVVKKIFDPLEIYDTLDADNSSEESQNEDEYYIASLIKECIQYASNYFLFSNFFISLDGCETYGMDIDFRNADYVGNYLEEYVADIYERNEYNDLECVGCQGYIMNLSEHSVAEVRPFKTESPCTIKPILITAEITGHFIKATPEVLDFGVCIFNSAYQLSFKICNESSGTQTISMKFPSIMVDYVKSDVSVTYIPPQAPRTVWIKFLPRKDVLTDHFPYYDKETCVLEFPIYVCVLSKTIPDVPPVKVTAYAVLTTEKCLKIIPVQTQFCRYLEGAVNLNLGECTLNETVYTGIKLLNNTLATQIYGFTDVPECLTISPNHGFGEIFPGEVRLLKMYFLPDVKDIYRYFTEGNEKGEHRICFGITLETISNVGQTKREFNYRRLRKSFETIFRELKSSKRTVLMKDMMQCAYEIKLELASSSPEDEKCPMNTSREDRYLEEYYGEAEESPVIDLQKQLCVTQLWLDAKILVPYVEFSYQDVVFPDTPCGSYATAEIDLVGSKTEFNLECDVLKKNFRPTILDFEASFKITGSTEEISIEPTCGTIRNGELKRLTLVVKPKTPEEMIIKTAKALKYSEVYEKKRQEYELKKQKALEMAEKKGKGGKKGGKKDDKKDKKDKSNKSSKSKKSGANEENEPEKKKEEEPVIIVTEKDLELEYLDYYPAEMCYWRSLDPYIIKTKFVCSIEYNKELIIRGTDTLYLEASCTVVRPDFITNLNVQRIDFGKVAIGMKRVEHVVIQNIAYDSIRPLFSIWNPFGPFSTPHIKDLNLPPEHFLQLPVVFEPFEEGETEEYFEICSGHTALPLIFQGIAETPKIIISPTQLVYRVDTKKKNLGECNFEIKNKGESDITINIEKMFELEGSIKEMPKPPEPPADEGKGKKDKNDKKGKKDKKAKAGKKGKPEIVPLVSNELTDSEKYSLENFFTLKNDDVYFDIFSADGNRMDIKPNGTKSITICFGVPEFLAKKKAEFIKKLNEKSKKGKGKGGKSSKGSKSSKKSKGGGKGRKGFDNRTYYVTKYNFMLNKTFVRDVIFVCAFTGK